MGQRWNQLSERDRRLIVLGAVVDAILRIAALVDLGRRPADDVRGRKWVWATAVGLVSSVGVVPLVYFLFGRRRRSMH